MPRRGKGRCKCAEATLFAPAGQKRCRVARLILGVSRERVGSGGACTSGTVGRRAGGTEACRPALHEATAFTQPSRGENGGGSPPPHTGLLPGEKQFLGPAPRLQRRPNTPKPAPAQGSHPLRIPFWGNGSRFPAAPHLQNAAGGKPLLVGLPPSIPSTAPFGPKRSTPAPFVTGRVCIYFEPTALAGGTAARRRLRAFWQVSVRIQSRSPRSIRRSACTPSGPAMPT